MGGADCSLCTPQPRYQSDFWNSISVMSYRFPNTVEPRYSASQGTGQNYALNRGFHYCQHRNNYENASWDQNLYTLLAEIRYKWVRYSGVSLYSCLPVERNWRDGLFITLEREYVVSIHATITGNSAFLMNQYVWCVCVAQMTTFKNEYPLWCYFYQSAKLPSRY